MHIGDSRNGFLACSGGAGACHICCSFGGYHWDTGGVGPASGTCHRRVSRTPHAGGMTSNDLVIEAEGLVKRFGTTKALRDGRASLFGEGSLRTPGSPAPRRPNASECR